MRSRRSSDVVGRACGSITTMTVLGCGAFVSAPPARSRRPPVGCQKRPATVADRLGGGGGIEPRACPLLGCVSPKHFAARHARSHEAAGELPRDRRLPALHQPRSAVCRARLHVQGCITSGLRGSPSLQTRRAGSSVSRTRTTPPRVSGSVSSSASRAFWSNSIRNRPWYSPVTIRSVLQFESVSVTWSRSVCVARLVTVATTRSRGLVLGHTPRLVGELIQPCRWVPPVDRCDAAPAAPPAVPRRRAVPDRTVPTPDSNVATCKLAGPSTILVGMRPGES